MSEVPLKPLGKQDIKKLELALILGTLLRGDVLKKAIEVHDKLTWLDSLLVAAGALARERAGIPVYKIAEELGRTEATIRNHLQEKTEAGKLVKKTYDELVEKKGVLEIKLPEIGLATEAEINELREKVKALEEENAALKAKISYIKDELQAILSKL